MPKIAIIGSGPTAIYTAHTLLLQKSPLRITMFEAQSEAGKGTPYHQDWNDAQMLSNIASIEIPPVTETLVEWLGSQTDYALSRMGIVREDITDHTFFPRVALGEYFQAQLIKLVQNARTLDVKTSHKVLDVRIVEEGVRLAVQGQGKKVHYPVFDYVVMATGHVWPTETEIKPGYFLSPWPASALKTIKNCHVGIRGTSLSAIDALVALSVAHGSFTRSAEGNLQYLPEPGTEAFHATMMSRKGILPEAEFYHTIPYLPLSICTSEAIDSLLNSKALEHLLDDIFALFKAELNACDPEYATNINLENLTLEEFSRAYSQERETHDPFIWAERNLAEAKTNQERKYTVPWRYAILRMHEIIGRVVPHLLAEDYKRFNAYFKNVFVDDYATVPHESIERLLALHDAHKLSIIKLGDKYSIDTESSEAGAILTKDNQCTHFNAFIEATGQRALSLREFPFPSLWEQGLLQKATTSEVLYNFFGIKFKKSLDIGGIALDHVYHPISDSQFSSRLYCVSLPFMLGQFPFAQGITSSYDMGKKVAKDILQQLLSNMDNTSKSKHPMKVPA